MYCHRALVLTMLDFFAPESQADAYVWLAVLAGHGFVGIIAVAAVWWALRAADVIDRPREVALALTVGGYLLGWEVIVQALGAGWPDALVDSFAVGCGAVIATSAWARKAGRIGWTMVLFGALAVAGVWRRRE